MQNRNSIRAVVLLMILAAVDVNATTKSITQEKPERYLNTIF